MQIGYVGEVVQSLQRARSEARESGRTLGRAIFFIGAGCSRSAGVPLAAEIARDLVCRLASTYRLGDYTEASAAFDALQSVGHFPEISREPDIDWYSVYNSCFQDHYKTPDHARTIFQRAVSSAGNQINWAHLCLGELVSQGYCSTLITTNFDLLALEGLATAGVIPVVSDGLESLGRIDGNPSYPQLIQLNGSIHTYRLRNKPEEIEAVANDHVASACIRDLVRSTGTIVFVGYAGREKAIMGLLKNALTEFSEKEIYWCSFEGNPENIGDGAQDIMRGNPNARILLKQDADRFFFELCRDLGIGSPRFVRDPIGAIEDQSRRIVKPAGSGTSSDIRAEISRLSEVLASTREAVVREQSSHQAERAIDVAREQRLRGEHKAALATLRGLLDSPNPDPDAVQDAAQSAFSLAQKTLDPFDVAESLRLARQAVELSEHGTPDWALMRARLGDAIDLAAHGHDNPDLLLEAVAAYEDALAIISKESDPDLWADIQDSVGSTYSRIADLTRDATHIDRALSAFDQAQTVQTRKDQPILWGETQISRAVALMTAGEIRRDVALLRASTAAQEEALQELTRERVPETWATCIHNLASAYGSIGYLSDDIPSLERALSIYEELSTDDSIVGSPADKAGLLQNTAHVLASLGGLNNDITALDKAISLYDDALSRFSKLELEFYTRQVSEARARVVEMRQKLMDRLKGGDDSPSES